jgi:hypothetical protein
MAKTVAFVMALVLGTLLGSLSRSGGVAEAQKCIPADQCCRVCSRGKACGNSCVHATFNCHKGRGCACDSAEVCDSRASERRLQ